MTVMFSEKDAGHRAPYLLGPIELQALNVLPMPVLVVGEGQAILYANTAAEDFFQSSAALLKRQRIVDLIAFGSPVLALIEEVQRRGASVSEYRLDLGSPRIGSERIVDVFASPLPSDGEAVVVMLQERTIAEKMDRQLTHRGAARSITALGAMLAHEIKNRSRASAGRPSCWKGGCPTRTGCSPS